MSRSRRAARSSIEKKARITSRRGEAAASGIGRAVVFGGIGFHGGRTELNEIEFHCQLAGEADGDGRPRPLQARDAILALVQRGAQQPGSKLPSGRRLAERLNMSRLGVREALRILEEEGQITRRVGIGTFVRNVPLVEARPDTLVGFTEMMARSGHQAGTGHLDVSEGRMSSEQADRRARRDRAL
jgi:DNA-binding transcriptional regulator YhcF (GntR family)